MSGMEGGRRTVLRAAVAGRVGASLATAGLAAPAAADGGGQRPRIAILLYDGLTALDAVGPYEVLSRVPGASVVTVAKRAGQLRTDTGVLGPPGCHPIHTSTDVT